MRVLVLVALPGVAFAWTLQVVRPRRECGAVMRMIFAPDRGCEVPPLDVALYGFALLALFSLLVFALMPGRSTRA